MGIVSARYDSPDQLASYRPSQDAKTFNQQVSFAQGGAVPVYSPASPGPVTQEQPSIFGPDDPEAGIVVHVIRPEGPWPFQIYRSTPFGYETNAEMQAQLAATPSLDPKAFGNRPGVPYRADLGLEEGDTVIVLDEKRLGYLEDQRRLLGLVDPPASRIPGIDKRDRQIDLLTDSIVQEVDWATAPQAVPDFDAVAVNIRARAPDDAVYQQAIDRAKIRMEATWKQQGRTADQIGKLLEAGKAGDLDKVRDLTKQQLVAVADSLGPDATSAQIEAAMVGRMGVYLSYGTGDPAYFQAVKDGYRPGTAETAAAGQPAYKGAWHEIFVERPINTVLDIAKAGGEDWHNKSMAALRGITDPATQTPEQVLAIMADPRIKAMVRQSLRHAEKLDSPEQGPVWQGWTQEDTILTDLSAIYSATFYADPAPRGKGQTLVDDMAGFIVDNTKHYDDEEGIDNIILDEVSLEFSRAFYQSAGDGHIPLALAVGAKTKGTDHPVFTQRQSPVSAVTDGVHDYILNVEQLAKTAGEDSRFLTNPLTSVGAGNLPREEQLALIDKMIAAADPEKMKKLEADLAAWKTALDGAEPLQLAFDAYGPALKGTPDFDKTAGELNKIPRPGPLPEAPGGVTPTNTLWVTRCARLFGSTLIKEWLPDAAKMPFDRATRSFSTFLFASNAAALVHEQFIDQLYVAPHTAMAISEAYKAVLPKDWQATLFGTDADGRPKSPARVGASFVEQNIDKLKVSQQAKGILRSLVAVPAKGVAFAPLDTWYIGVDGYNSYAYFFGKTDDDKRDIVRGIAYGIVTAGDFAFLAAGNAAANTTAAAAGTFLARSAFFWTGIGAALLLIGSGLNYGKGLYDHAHEFDAETAKAWELLGIDNPETAKNLGMGAIFGDDKSFKNAGPLLVEIFRHAGYTPKQMTAFINSHWTPEQANTIATYIKERLAKNDDGTFEAWKLADVEIYAERQGIAFPDYYNDSNMPVMPEAPTWEWTGP